MATSTTQSEASTPLKRHLSTMAPYTTHAKYRVKEVSQMGKEMLGYIVGPMPVPEFLDEFFPMKGIEEYVAKPFRKGIFKKTVTCESETSAYQPFIECAASLAPGLEFVNSSSHLDSSCRTDFSFDVKPDVCVYNKGATASRSGPTDVSSVEIVIEFKWKARDDPFSSLEKRDGDSQHGAFMCNSKTALDTLGQITAYASAQFGSQFRTHCYSVLIVKNIARIVRWDRSGAIVTAPIAYDRQAWLAEFLHRFSKASPAMRGVDETVTVPPISNSLEARECLNLPVSVPMFQIEVGSLSCREKLRVIAPAPIAPPYSPPGRSTRGLVAYDPASKRKVFLKDTWRADAVGIEPEGETYGLLHEHEVRNIPQCIAAGDVSNDLYHATQTQKYMTKDWAARLFGSTETARPSAHRHYRLVLDTVGAKLTEFSSTRELVTAVSDALDAHEDAVKKSLVLHRDLSPGNIIIVDGRGMLIDWDLSKRMSGEEPCGPRRPMRTGTWQFMSGALVYFKDAHHTVEDDLESVLYVLLWVAIVYSHSNLSPERRTLFINQTFDTPPIEGFGGDAKMVFLGNPRTLETMQFTDRKGTTNRKALKDLCIGLVAVLARRYPKTTENNWVACTSGHKATHSDLSLLFSIALRSQDWPENDESKPQELKLATDGGDFKPYRVTKTDWQSNAYCPKSMKRQRTGGGEVFAGEGLEGCVDTSEEEQGEELPVHLAEDADHYYA